MSVKWAFFEFFFYNLISPTNIGPKSSIENALKQMHGLKKINFLCPTNYLSTEELCRNFAKLTQEALLWFWDIATDLLIYVYNSLKKSWICKKNKKAKRKARKMLCFYFMAEQNVRLKIRLPLKCSSFWAKNIDNASV